MRKRKKCKPVRDGGQPAPVDVPTVPHRFGKLEIPDDAYVTAITGTNGSDTLSGEYGDYWRFPEREIQRRP